VNPYTSPTSTESRIETSGQSVSWVTANGSRLVICIALIASGLASGVVSLALISNQFGNTDSFGIALLGFSGWLTGTGVSYLRTRLHIAFLVGIAFAPAAIFALFVLYWAFLIFVAVMNASH